MLPEGESNFNEIWSDSFRLIIAVAFSRIGILISLGFEVTTDAVHSVFYFRFGAAAGGVEPAPKSEQYVPP